MMKLKLTQIGNSVGLILPKELLARLRVGKGDHLFASELPDGLKLTPYDEEFEKDMELAEEIMRRRRNVLKELAK